MHILKLSINLGILSDLLNSVLLGPNIMLMQKKKKKSWVEGRKERVPYSIASNWQFNPPGRV